MPNPLDKKVALEKLKTEVIKAKLDCFEQFDALNEMSVEELQQNCGYRNKEQAIFRTFNKTQEKIVRLSKEFVKQFPD